MQIFRKKNALIHCLSFTKLKKERIGFVPTMGALHKGHISLVDISKKQNHITVVSIFVNPTQFDNPDDLKKYPNTIEKDLSLLEKSNCDVVYIPTVDDLYPKDVVSNYFSFGGIEHQMEGAFRKGHFDGVATVIQSFFQIVTPTNAYFGEKDFQQLQIVKQLVKNKSLPISIVGCPIFREKDGLAMSSRNLRLTTDQRATAPFVYKTLQLAKKQLATNSLEKVENFVQDAFSNHTELELEYFTIADEESLVRATTVHPNKKYRAFIAVFAGEIRLIDNISIS